MSLVITHNLRGFVLKESVDYTGDTFDTDDGQTFSKDRCWPATIFNLEIASYLYCTHQHTQIKLLKQLRTIEQSADLELEGVQAFAYLKKVGCTLDEELRIRKVMTPPFTEITEDHIAPLIQVHLDKCEKLKKDPSTMPLNFIYVQKEDGTGVIIFEQDGKPVAGTHPGGTICLAGKQVVLGFRDWFLIPKGSSGGILMQFLKCEPTGATSMKELCGKEKILVEDGVLIQSGLRKIAFAEISIDSFI